MASREIVFSDQQIKSNDLFYQQTSTIIDNILEKKISEGQKQQLFEYLLIIISKNAKEYRSYLDDDFTRKL